MYSSPMKLIRSIETVGGVSIYLMGEYVRQCQHGGKENDRELPDPACGGVSGLSAAYRLQH